MKIRNGGFTLIEVLVVVLIIGILAAVALPQYQKAVLKSRYSALMPIAKSLAEANEVYFLGRGEYATSVADLDVAGQDSYPDGTNVSMPKNENLSYILVTNDNVNNARYVVYQKHSPNFAGTTMCEAGDEKTQELCVALGGQPLPEGSGNSQGDEFAAYLLSGSYGSTDTFATSGDEDDSEESGNDTPTLSCNVTDKPNDIGPTETNPATGKAICINGQWKYQWTGGATNTGTECNGNSEYACAGTIYGRSTTGQVARCWGTASNACAGGIFTSGGNFCYGNVANACADTNFSGHSYCWASAPNACTGAIIQETSWCVAQTTDACNGVLYGVGSSNSSSNGCCREDGGNCPIGSPKCNNGNGYASAVGWHGDCCNPAYMVSGECPDGITRCGS